MFKAFNSSNNLIDTNLSTVFQQTLDLVFLASFLVLLSGFILLMISLFLPAHTLFGNIITCGFN